jgi:hypothetical protein
MGRALDSAVTIQDPVKVVDSSGNQKTGEVSVTYTSQASCPGDCPYLDNGCYGEQGRVGITTRPLNRSDVLDPVKLAEWEAEDIGGLSARRDLRLHVVGDSTTGEGTRMLAAASDRFRAKGLARYGRTPAVWTYTHAWHQVDRADWGAVSVLASCETSEGVRQAAARGYAASVTVERFKSAKAYPLPGAEEFKVLPCPEQVGDTTCVECRLCMDDGKLRQRKLVIGFQLFGQRVGRARLALRVITET